MTKKLLTFFLLLAFVTPVFCLPPDKEKDKMELSFMDMNDPAIGFVAFDVHSMILRKSRGYLWPAVKLTFMQDKGDLIFIVTAIDNSWCNMFVEEEVTHGYSTVNGRLFIITTKGEIPEKFNEFFTFDHTVEKKSFYKAAKNAKPVAKNPVWSYLYRGEEMATVIKSFYTENLGR